MVKDAIPKARRVFRESGPPDQDAMEIESCVSEFGAVNYRRTVAFLDRLRASLRVKGVALFARGIICFCGSYHIFFVFDSITYVFFY